VNGRTLEPTLDISTWLPSFRPSACSPFRRSVSIWNHANNHPPLLLAAVISNLPTTDNSIDRVGSLTVRGRRTCPTSQPRRQMELCNVVGPRSIFRRRQRRHRGSGWRSVGWYRVLIRSTVDARPTKRSAGQSGSRHHHRISDKHFVVPSGTLLEPQMRKKRAQSDAQLRGSTTFASRADQLSTARRARRPLAEQN